MLVKLVEVAKDWVVVVTAASPDPVVVVRDCGFSKLDEFIMAVVECMVIAVPVGVEVAERRRVVAVDEDPPVEFMVVRDWIVVIVAASPVRVLFMRDQLVLLVTVVSARDTVLPVIVGDCLVDVVIPEEAEFITRVTLAVPAVLPVGWLVGSAVWLTPVTDSVPAAEDVDRSWPDTNINGRSIPNKKDEAPRCRGVFAEKQTIKHNKNRTYHTC